MEKPTVSSIPAGDNTVGIPGGDNTFSKHARFYTYLGYRFWRGILLFLGKLNGIYDDPW